MDHASAAIRLIIRPVTFVARSVLPNLSASTVPQALLIPLTLVHGAVVEDVWSARDQVRVVSLVVLRVVFEWPEGLLCHCYGFICVIRHHIKLARVDWCLLLAALLVKATALKLLL